MLFSPAVKDPIGGFQIGALGGRPGPQAPLANLVDPKPPLLDPLFGGSGKP